MSELTEIISPEEFLSPVPKTLKRPCDYGLEIAISNLETQLGTIEAYNRLSSACARIRAKIIAGNAEAQNPMFRTDAGFAKDEP